MCLQKQMAALYFPTAHNYKAATAARAKGIKELWLGAGKCVEWFKVDIEMGRT